MNCGINALTVNYYHKTLALTLMPTRGGGGGGGTGTGFLVRTIRLSVTTLEPFHIGFPKFVTFCLYPLDTFSWRNFRRIEE